MDKKKLAACSILILFLNSFCFAGRWKMFAPGVDNPANVFFTSSKNGVITGDAFNGNLPTSPIRWTNDGGKKWHGAKIELAGSVKYYNLTGLWFSNNKTGWVVANVWIPVKGSKTKTVIKSILLKTMDGGKTWIKQGLPANIRLFSNIWFDKKNKNGWLISGWIGNTIWKTKDGGRTWRTVTVPGNGGSAFYVRVLCFFLFQG
ncbi:MAG: hypothetical protein M1501_03050 [Candidatus Omnitrophica bacterium]|nr:hypothetical protein [Candidatus Omnitrophota bacterium]